MKQLDITIQNPTGLHARPAKIFVNTAKQFKSDIRVQHREKKANAKSLISMLTLGVETGSEIRILVNGADEDEAIGALETAVLSGLGESEHIAVSSQQSAVSGQRSAVSGQQSADGSQQSAVSSQQSAVSSQQSAANGQRPATSDQQPATSNQRPATSNQQPATSNQQPATSNQQPATSNQQPATSNQQPAKRHRSRARNCHRSGLPIQTSRTRSNRNVCRFIGRANTAARSD